MISKNKKAKKGKRKKENENISSIKESSKSIDNSKIKHERNLRSGQDPQKNVSSACYQKLKEDPWVSIFILSSQPLSHPNPTLSL